MTTGTEGPGPRVVAFGGGHGLAASLLALRRVTRRLTAVVTVADDGGSSGRLRRELGVLPPGDLRMALAALAEDGERGAAATALLQHRFPGQGDLGGHAAGNLLLVALAQTLGGFVPALAAAGSMVGAQGRVLPVSETPLDIIAEVSEHPAGIAEVRGQVAVAITPGRVRRVRLEPAAPPACPQVLTAVAEAEWLVFGPGSWFTSVLPHLLVPAVAAAVQASPARRVVTLNLSSQAGETAGMDPADHLAALVDHAPGLHVDVVLADPAVVPEGPADHRRLAAAADRMLGARLVVAPVAVADGRPAHDPVALAAALCPILRTETGAPRTWR